jgi:7-cyano-7-deazaguanine synthase
MTLRSSLLSFNKVAMKVLLLFSGGKESVYSLQSLLKSGHEVFCLMFDYGQRSNVQEASSIAYYATKFQCKHRVINVTLAMPDAIRNGTDGDDHVIFRNGAFLALAINYLKFFNCDAVSIGVTNTEGSHNDGSFEFLKNFRKMLRPMYPDIKIISPTASYSGYQLYVKVMRDGLDVSNMWSCMTSNADGYCGECTKCRKFIEEYTEDKFKGMPGYNHYIRYAERFYGLFLPRQL